MLRMLFVGTLNYPPNEEAVRILVLKVLPLLRIALSEPWRLCVVGRHASTSLQALLETCPEVEFVPSAAAVRPWYQRSHMVLVPVFAGGGTKFKSLEGLAHQRPVVSTEHGMRGLNAVPGKHFLLANTPEQFTEAIQRLASSEALCKQLAEAGRHLVTPDWALV
jgi:glycosyltransferase involved in cell wall biosynthesis